MSQFLEQTRRATQKVLQTVGIAKESSDDEEFVAAFQDYNVLTSTVKEIGSDIRTIQAGLERLVNATDSLARHLQNSSSLLCRYLTEITGGGGGSDASASKLLETLSIQLADAQQEIIGGSLNRVLGLINNAVVPQLLKECKDDQLTASTLEKRKRAHLDYDAKIRSHSSTPYQIEEARRAFTQLSASATSILSEKSKVRTAAIVAAATAVTKSLREHYDSSAAAMASSAEVSNLLGGYVNAPGTSKQQQQIPPKQNRPQQQQQQAPVKPQSQKYSQSQNQNQKYSQSQQPKQASTFFDMLDSEGVQSTPSPQPQKQPQQQQQAAPSSSTFFDMLGSDATQSSAATPTQQPQRQQQRQQQQQQANTLDIFAQAPPSTSKSPASGNDLLSGWDTNTSSGRSGASDTLADLMGETSSQQSSGDILMPSLSPNAMSYGNGSSSSSSSSSSSFTSMFTDLGIDIQSSSQSNGYQQTIQLPPDETAVLATKDDVDRWANEGGRKANLRALLSTMETVLWEGSGWKKITLADLVDPTSVKNYYKKAITVVHPDKVVGQRRQELARHIFAALRQSHDAFRRELEAQEAARARAQAMARGSSSTAGDDVD